MQLAVRDTACSYSTPVLFSTYFQLINMIRMLLSTQRARFHGEVMANDGTPCCLALFIISGSFFCSRFLFFLGGAALAVVDGGAKHPLEPA